MGAYSIRVNGVRREVEADEETPLLWILRDDLNLKGTKFGCGMGLCGACTVHLGDRPTRSCVTPVSAVGDAAITTIEAIGEVNVGKQLQDAWIALDVPQCGYCQSGQIMSAAALISSNPTPSDEEIDAAMSGNLCRCATYTRIRRAMKKACGLPYSQDR